MKVDAEEIVDHLSNEFRAALVEAIRSVGFSGFINEGVAFQAFKVELRRRCRTWETVPDRFVKE